MGKTPYTGTSDAGQINLKLVPDSNGQNLISYETKLNLVPGIQTVVEREFGPTEESSSGDIISFDKMGGSLAGLVVISTPDNAQVWIDGTSQGFAPYNFNSITTGPHRITVKSAGYADRNMNIKTIEGLKLTVFAKLAKGDSISASPSPTPTPIPGPKRFVLISNTPTGFLRMRTEPDTKGEEIAELKTGQKYLYLETDTDSGWYKIQYQDPAPGLPNGITGWVSGQYSKIVDDKGNTFNPNAIASPSATPTLAP